MDSSAPFAGVAAATSSARVESPSARMRLLIGFGGERAPVHALSRSARSCTLPRRRARLAEPARAPAHDRASTARGPSPHRGIAARAGALRWHAERAPSRPSTRGGSAHSSSKWRCALPKSVRISSWCRPIANELVATVQRLARATRCAILVPRRAGAARSSGCWPPPTSKNPTLRCCGGRQLRRRGVTDAAPADARKRDAPPRCPLRVHRASNG